MPRIGQYCKAYALERLEEFPEWPAEVSARLRTTPPADDLGTYVFVHENLVVTEGICPDEDVLFDGSHSEWASFCRDILEFEVPADMQA